MKCLFDFKLINCMFDNKSIKIKNIDEMLELFCKIMLRLYD